MRALVLAALLLVAGCASTAPRVTPIPTSDATAGHTLQRRNSPRTIPDAFFGFNGASIIRNPNIDVLLDPKLQDKLASFPARLIRIPTGTAAQWINWRTGKFIDDPTSPFAKIGADRHPVRMNDWAAMIKRTGATPVWDLNVLNATLDDQIEMLEAAEKLGMPVRYIELGNELWDVRSIYPKVFPTGSVYAQKMNSWIPRLRARFPNAKIAVSGADPSDAFFARVFGQRYVDWNTEVLASIKGADAIAIHPYWTLPDRAVPGSDVTATLAAGPNAWARFATSTLAKIPDSMSVWLTEWNQAAWGTKAGTQIWAQALSVAAVAMEQLVYPHVTMSLIHNIVDSGHNPQDVGTAVTFPMFTGGDATSGPMRRTALGYALPLLFGAIGPGSTVQEAVLSDTKLRNATRVRAVLITGAHPGAVLVNPGSQPLTVRLPASMSGTWTVTTRTARLNAQPGWVVADTVTTSRSTTTGTVEVPPACIVRIERR